MKPKRPLVHGGAVVEGRVVYDQPVLRDAALRAWTGLRITETIAREVPTRSLRQNAYLWAAIYPAIAEASGYSVEDIHDIMRLRHNSKTVVDPFTGTEERVGQTTTKLSVEDFGVYIERCMVDGAEQFGISFAPPRAGEEYR